MATQLGEPLFNDRKLGCRSMLKRSQLIQQAGEIRGYGWLCVRHAQGDIPDWGPTFPTHPQCLLGGRPPLNPGGGLGTPKKRAPHKAERGGVVRDKVLFGRSTNQRPRPPPLLFKKSGETCC